MIAALPEEAATPRVCGVPDEGVLREDGLRNRCGHDAAGDQDGAEAPRGEHRPRVPSGESLEGDAPCSEQHDECGDEIVRLGIGRQHDTDDHQAGPAELA